MRFLPSLFVICLLASCTVQARLTLGTPALVEASVSLTPAAKGSWANLRDLDPTLPENPLDPALLKRGLEAGASVTTTLAATSLSFSLADPKKFFPDLRADTGSWEVSIDRAAVRRWAALTPWAGSPAVESLLPGPETSITEAEYRDLLVYLLGPTAGEGAAKTLIDSSVVQFTIVAPRPIKTAEGAAQIDGRSALYRWPLVRVLTLETPLRVKLVF